VIHKLKDYIRFGGQLVTGSRMKHERWIADLRRTDLSVYLEGNAPLTLLDLANGQLRPQYLLLKAGGYRICGIDIVNRPGISATSVLYALARRFYWWRAGVSAGGFVEKTLVCGNVDKLPFRANVFDLVTSVAAFEHFLNVPAVVKELYRVIKPGGLVWVLVHLFSSPSGGHNVSLVQVPLRNIPRGIEPWDHLRKRRLPFHVPLNEWRRDQYLEEFQRHFEILKHYCAMREGEYLLTPQIENELSDFSRDELTCGAYVIAGRKPLSTSSRDQEQTVTV
jgi:SAM-dependent methyltransferase